jgi:hypothetical protein
MCWSTLWPFLSPTHPVTLNVTINSLRVRTAADHCDTFSSSKFDTLSGLPDRSRYNLPKRENIPNNHKYTTRPLHICKLKMTLNMYQHYFIPQKYTIIVIFVYKYTTWQNLHLGSRKNCMLVGTHSSDKEWKLTSSGVVYASHGGDWSLGGAYGSLRPKSQP